MDGGAFLDLGRNETVTLSLADGTHEVTVRATDVAGNSITRTVTLTMDTNVFSFTGPYAGIPTAAIVAAAVAVAA